MKCSSANIFLCLALLYGGKSARAQECTPQKINLCEKNCKQGNAAACSILGWIYWSGLGVDTDLSKATAYFNLSCSKKIALGCAGEGMQLLQGRGLQKDEAAALFLLEKACGDGSGEGCFLLAQHHLSNGRRDQAQIFFKKAEEDLPAGCDQGQLWKCVMQGFCRFSQRDGASAAAWYEKACKPDVQLGCGFLGDLYKNGNGVPKNVPKAFSLFKRVCQEGQQEWCVDVGLMYEKGAGVGKDSNQAAALYEKACLAGVALGCNNLGVMLEGSELPGKDLGRAARMYEEACNAGNGDGCENLGNMYFRGTGSGKDLPRAFALYEKSCLAGNHHGCVLQGARTENGEGTNADPTKAALLYDKACGAGEWEGCSGLASLYKEGKGVERDLKKTASLYEKACGLGDSYGCAYLGYMYANGLGVNQDFALSKTWSEKACQNGDAHACNTLGVLFQKGQGVAKNLSKASRYYDQACKQDDAFGCSNLGMLFEKGEGVRQDEAKAASLYQKACDKGHAAGCGYLASLNQKGLGVAKDVQKAASLYSKACAGADVASCSQHGQLLEKGEGIAQDLAQAASLYQRACAAQDAFGCGNLGLLYEKGAGVTQDISKAMEYYEKGCVLGNGFGCNNLGVIYENNPSGRQDPKQAVGYYQKACSQGDQVGCQNLGNLFRSGFGVTQDFNKAASLYEQACNAHIAHGCRNLGMMYESGEGVGKDFGKAASKYKQACDGLDGAACGRLGDLFQTGKGVEKNAKKAAALFAKACLERDTRSCVAAGICHEKGEGVAKDPKQAALFYQQACDWGDVSGCYDLGLIYEKAEGVGRDLAKARSLFEKACDKSDDRGCLRLGLLLLSQGDEQAQQNNVHQALQQYQQAVGRIIPLMRQLALLRPVPLQEYTKEQLSQTIRRELAEEVSKESFLSWDAIQKALGTLDASLDTQELMQNLLSDQVAGFYDTRDRSVHYVLEPQTPADQPTFLDKLLGKDKSFDAGSAKDVLAHEIMHALSDQHYDHAQMKLQALDNSDRQLALDALTEGEAMLTMLAFSSKDWNGSETLRFPPKLLKFLMDTFMPLMLVLDSGMMARTPPIIREQLVFPYVYGALFCLAGAGEKGWKALDQAYLRLPQSSEQILHPEKYWQTPDWPKEVQMDPLPAPAGWTEVGRDVMGEFQIKVLLEAQQGSVSATGWGGDQIAAFRASDGKLGFVWFSTWDSEKDAQEFADACRTHYAISENTSQNPASSAQQEPKVMIHRRGLDVVVIGGFDRADAEALLRVAIMAGIGEQI